MSYTLIFYPCKTIIVSSTKTQSFLKVKLFTNQFTTYRQVNLKIRRDFISRNEQRADMIKIITNITKLLITILDSYCLFPTFFTFNGYEAIYVCEYIYYCWQCLLSKPGDSKEIGGIWMNRWGKERRKSIDQVLFIGSLKCEGLENVRSVKLTYAISAGGHQSQPQAVNNP